MLVCCTSLENWTGITSGGGSIPLTSASGLSEEATVTDRFLVIALNLEQIRIGEEPRWKRGAVKYPLRVRLSPAPLSESLSRSLEPMTKVGL